MKPSLFIPIAACMLLFAACKHDITRSEDESIPGHEAAYTLTLPAGTSPSVEYYYFPDYDMYYHMPTEDWIYKDGDKWTTDADLPEGMDFNPYTARSIEIGYYNCPPWMKSLAEEEKPAGGVKKPSGGKPKASNVSYVAPVKTDFTSYDYLDKYIDAADRPEPKAKPEPYFLPSQPIGTLPPGVKPKFVKKPPVPAKTSGDECVCPECE